MSGGSAVGIDWEILCEVAAAVPAAARRRTIA
jgi:hypothetical protein